MAVRCVRPLAAVHMAKRATLGSNPLTRHTTAVTAALDAPKKKATGRKPTGIGGAKVSDYSRTTVWLPPATKATLGALSRLLGKPQWRIIVDSLESYETTLDPADKTTLKRLLSRR